MSEFKKETDLCRAFLDSLSDDWKTYPEQDSWDFLIQRGSIQIGVQAKLIACMKVLVQALPYNAAQPRNSGPHYRAVLIARWPGRTQKAMRRNRDEFCSLARHLRILVMYPPELGMRTLRRHRNKWLPVDYMVNQTRFLRKPPWEVINWRHYRWHSSSPVWVPPFEPDLPAGVPAPSHVSAWQMAALEIHRECERKGWICLDDARKVVNSMTGVDFQPPSLLKRFWFATKEAALGRQKRWRPLKERNRRVKTPAEEWPDLWKKVADDPARKNADGAPL